MKPFAWDRKKNKDLKKNRNIGFEDIVEILIKEGPVNVFDHPRPEKYPGQKIFAVRAKGYVFLVPFIETKDTIFLKTIFPSRKAKKKFLKNGEGNV